MDRTEHIRLLKETGGVVIPIIRATLDAVAVADRPCFELFPSRRLLHEQPLLRPYLVRLGYEIAGGTNWRTIAPGCAAAELFNISTYQANIAFDSKLCVTTPEERGSQYASAMITLSAAVDLLQRSAPTCETFAMISGDLHAANADIYAAQLEEIALASRSPGDYERAPEAFRSEYELRCRRLGGSLTRWCLATGARFAGDLEVSRQLAVIGDELGTAGQMLNDMADLVPEDVIGNRTFAVRYQNAYSDLCNRRLTLPIALAFRHGSSDVRDLLERARLCGAVPTDVHRALTASIAECGVFARMREELSIRYKRIRRLIGELPGGDGRRRLFVAATSLLYNKYFSTVRSLGKTISITEVDEWQACVLN
jgi:hypothetical protein